MVLLQCGISLQSFSSFYDSSLIFGNSLLLIDTQLSSSFLLNFSKSGSALSFFNYLINQQLCPTLVDHITFTLKYLCINCINLLLNSKRDLLPLVPSNKPKLAFTQSDYSSHSMRRQANLNEALSLLSWSYSLGLFRELCKSLVCTDFF